MTPLLPKSILRTPTWSFLKDCSIVQCVLMTKFRTYTTTDEVAQSAHSAVALPRRKENEKFSWLDKTDVFSEKDARFQVSRSLTMIAMSIPKRATVAIAQLRIIFANNPPPVLLASNTLGPVQWQNAHGQPSSFTIAVSHQSTILTLGDLLWICFGWFQKTCLDPRTCTCQQEQYRNAFFYGC